MNRIAVVAWLAFICPILDSAHTAAPTVRARMLITIAHYYSHETPTLTRDDLIVTHHSEPLPVTKVTPLDGDRARLELFFLVDNCSNWPLGNRFEELRRFVLSQPSSTTIGVAHIQNGRLRLTENPTEDHERAARALRASTGCKPSSPYLALTKLVRDWPQGPSRRAVLLISNGADPAAANELLVPSAEAAIEAFQRTGVTLYAIYHPSADYRTTASSRLYTGQVQLAHAAIETGGEAYFKGFGPLPLLAPFLADITDHLASQYLLEFIANSTEGPGTLQEVTIRSTKLPEGELMAPYKVWVTGVQSGRPSENAQDYLVCGRRRQFDR
jgi:hypothetical protein